MTLPSFKQVLQQLSDLGGIVGGVLFALIWFYPTGDTLFWAMVLSILSSGFEFSFLWRTLQTILTTTAISFAIGIVFGGYGTSNAVFYTTTALGVGLILINGFQILEKVASWVKILRELAEHYDPD